MGREWKTLTVEAAAEEEVEEECHAGGRKREEGRSEHSRRGRENYQVPGDPPESERERQTKATQRTLNSAS